MLTCLTTCESMTADYIDIPGFAELAGVKVETLRTFRHRGILPEPAFFAGQSPVWARADVDEWLKTRRRPGKPPLREPEQAG